MKAAEIRAGSYYLDAVGFVFLALGVKKVGKVWRIRWKILRAPKLEYRGPRSLGELGEWNLSNFATRMTASVRRSSARARKPPATRTKSPRRSKA